MCSGCPVIHGIVPLVDMALTVPNEQEARAVGVALECSALRKLSDQPLAIGVYRAREMELGEKLMSSMCASSCMRKAD